MAERTTAGSGESTVRRDGVSVRGRRRLDPLGRLRVTLQDTFGGPSDGPPQWQLDLENGEDAGYFAPHSAVWAVHGGMTPIAAGVRALLIQALHPGALAGVAEHSNFRQDALGRLAGTIRWIFTVTYGDTAAAKAACDDVRRRHVPVRGHYEAGQARERAYYSANLPHLDLWVHCAFAEAFLSAYELFAGDVPRPPDALPGESGADAYVREWAVAGELMGVEDPPRSKAQLLQALRGFDERGELRVDPRTREVVEFIRHAPLDPSLRVGYAALFRGVVDTLPRRASELLGLKPSGLPLPGGRRVSLAWVGRLGTSAVLRVAGATLVKVGPAELAARRRLVRLGVPGARTGLRRGTVLESPDGR